MEFERLIKYENNNSKENFVNWLGFLSKSVSKEATELAAKQATKEAAEAVAKQAAKEAAEKQAKQLVGSVIKKQSKLQIIRKMANGTTKNFVKYRKPIAKMIVVGGVAGTIASATGVFGKAAQNGIQNAASDVFSGVLNTLGDAIPEDVKQGFSYICIIMLGIIAIWFINLFSFLIPPIVKLILISGIIITVCILIASDIENENEDLESINK